jgi:hypothetical protein
MKQCRACGYSVCRCGRNPVAPPVPAAEPERVDVPISKREALIKGRYRVTIQHIRGRGHSWGHGSKGGRLRSNAGGRHMQTMRSSGSRSGDSQ